jgi:hypothetical protein
LGRIVFGSGVEKKYVKGEPRNWNETWKDQFYYFWGEFAASEC